MYVYCTECFFRFFLAYFFYSPLTTDSCQNKHFMLWYCVIIDIFVFSNINVLQVLGDDSSVISILNCLFIFSLTFLLLNLYKRRKYEFLSNTCRKDFLEYFYYFIVNYWEILPCRFFQFIHRNSYYTHFKAVFKILVGGVHAIKITF